MEATVFGFGLACATLMQPNKSHVLTVAAETSDILLPVFDLV